MPYATDNLIVPVLYSFVKNMVANNITIYQLAQSGDSLETYYTNLIGGCQND